jgi:hypothetical protein
MPSVVEGCMPEAKGVETGLAPSKLNLCNKESRYCV